MLKCGKVDCKNEGVWTATTVLPLSNNTNLSFVYQGLICDVHKQDCIPATILTPDSWPAIDVYMGRMNAARGHDPVLTYDRTKMLIQFKKYTETLEYKIKRHQFS